MGTCLGGFYLHLQYESDGKIMDDQYQVLEKWKILLKIRSYTQVALQKNQQPPPPLMQEHMHLARNVKVCSHVVAKQVEFH